MAVTFEPGIDSPASIGIRRVWCRCCGKEVFNFDREPIHTSCISRHWGKHKSGQNASRCREFGARTNADPDRCPVPVTKTLHCHKAAGHKGDHT